MQSLRQHLLTKLAEECMEVAQRALKSIQFGATEIQKGQTKTNAQRLRDEITDLEAVIGLIENTPDVAYVSHEEKLKGYANKGDKILKYRTYSQELGMVE